MSDGVAVTGLGIVSSIGLGKDAFWEAARAGRSGARSIESLSWYRPGDSLHSRVCAPVTGFDPVRWGLPERDLERIDPTTRFALAAAEMALSDAGLASEETNPRRGFHQIADADPDRVAVVIGTGIGGLTTVERTHESWARLRDRTKVKRYALPMLIPNAVAAQVAIRYQARGECLSLSTACASGTMAIGEAYRILRSGAADVVLAGGAECALSTHDGYGFVGFDLLRAMSERTVPPERASCPFDRERDGFVMSEGAAVLVLERPDHARARGARVYAEVCGYASNCDAWHMLMPAPEPERIVSLLRDTMRGAGLVPGDVDYVNAHGTSTPANDRNETRAIRDAFGPAAQDLVVTSLKSMTGHAIGASGAIEAAQTALSIHTGIVPPTINLATPDPECDLDYAAGGPVRREVRAALSSSYGFGGHNACLAFRK